MSNNKLSTGQVILIALVLIIIVNLLSPLIRFLARIATVLIIAGLVVYLINKHKKA